MITAMGLSGSLRRGSYNAAVLRAAGSLMPSDSELRIESIAGIPLYDGDDEAAHGVPDLVSRLKDAIVAADGLLLVTPEYNNSIPGVAKNASSRIARGARHRRERRDHGCCYPRQYSQVHGGLRWLCSWAKAINILRTAGKHKEPCNDR